MVDPLWVRRASMRVKHLERRLYVALTGGLAIVDLGSDGRLAPRGRAELDVPPLLKLSLWVSPRNFAVSDGTVYLEGGWPKEMITLDVSDPARPRRLGSHYGRHRGGDMLLRGGLLYVLYPYHIGIYRPRGPDEPVLVRELAEGPMRGTAMFSDSPFTTGSRLLGVVGDHFCTVGLDNRLTIYALGYGDGRG